MEKQNLEYNINRESAKSVFSEFINKNNHTSIDIADNKKHSLEEMALNLNIDNRTYLNEKKKNSETQELLSFKDKTDYKLNGMIDHRLSIQESSTQFTKVISENLFDKSTQFNSHDFENDARKLKDIISKFNSSKLTIINVVNLCFNGVKKKSIELGFLSEFNNFSFKKNPVLNIQEMSSFDLKQETCSFSVDQNCQTDFINRNDQMITKISIDQKCQTDSNELNLKNIKFQQQSSAKTCQTLSFEENNLQLPKKVISFDQQSHLETSDYFLNSFDFLISIGSELPLGV